MMKLSKTLIMILFLALTSSVSAQTVSEKKNFIKSMAADRGTRMEIVNKYGDIHITTWNKDSVYIMAEIEAFAPNRARLEKMFDGINVDMTGTSSLIVAKTRFDQSLTEILESFKGLTDKVIDYNSRVKINYFINAPDFLDFNIENQLGDISMETNRGTISVTLSNGSFKAASLDRISDMRLSFGNVDIGSVKSARIEPNFSELVIGESNDLTINSTSSRFNLERAGIVETESRRDKFFIDKISSLNGTSYFTDFKVQELGKEARLTLKYGSLDVGTLDRRFDNIDIKSVYSDLTLSCDPSASYRYEIRHTNSFVVVPERNAKSEKEPVNEERKEYVITGVVGGNPGSQKIIIEATKGNIYLR
jgi:hypothetical protein